MSSIGWIAVVVGIICLLLAFFGSSLGIGGNNFGPKHIIILVVGIVLVVGGLVAALRRPERVAP
jgi:hypothetical protein